MRLAGRMPPLLLLAQRLFGIEDSVFRTRLGLAMRKGLWVVEKWSTETEPNEAK